MKKIDLPSLSEDELLTLQGIVLEASGIRFETDGTTQPLLYIYRSLPPDIKSDVKKHGIDDPKTRKKIYDNCRKSAEISGIIQSNNALK